MLKVLSGFCAIALVLGMAVGCTDTSRDRIGGNPGDRTPAASPPMSDPAPGAATGSPEQGGSGGSGAPRDTAPAPRPELPR